MATTTGTDTASPGDSPKTPSFKRVYQACENCRRKKQRCNLGDPASPKPPCHTCRRASLPCVLPKKKRKGRPPKISRDSLASGRRRAAVAISPNPDNSTDGEATSHPAWHASMGSFEPVVETRDDVSSSGGSLDQRAPTSYDQRMASQRLAMFPLRNTLDAIRLLDQAEGGSPRDDRGPNTQDAQQDEQRSTPGETTNVLGSSIFTPPFFLLQEGYIDETRLFRLFSFYVRSVHPVTPLIPYKRMQITPEHILTMAGEEPHFMAAILVVTASLSGDQALHDRLWQRVQSLFAEVAIKGVDASIEVIEGLILLSGM